MVETGAIVHLQEADKHATQETRQCWQDSVDLIMIHDIWPRSMDLPWDSRMFITNVYKTNLMRCVQNRCQVSVPIPPMTTADDG